MKPVNVSPIPSFSTPIPGQSHSQSQPPSQISPIPSLNPPSQVSPIPSLSTPHPRLVPFPVSTSHPRLVPFPVSQPPIPGQSHSQSLNPPPQAFYHSQYAMISHVNLHQAAPPAVQHKLGRLQERHISIDAFIVTGGYYITLRKL